MKPANGYWVSRFEEAFAEHVSARYAIALCNGTATLHTAIAALGTHPTERVIVPPLTMSSTSLAVLHAGLMPHWVDVSRGTWVLPEPFDPLSVTIQVALFGLHNESWSGERVIVDAAQTLMQHTDVAFTSYSFQASKILPLSEGGMLVTNDEELALRAREFSSLGYRMSATQARIDPVVLKHPDTFRHHTLGWNYRMSDLVAERGVALLRTAFWLLQDRAFAAAMYREVVEQCDWLMMQSIPETWRHDWWTFPLVMREPSLWTDLAARITHYGGERPYAAWRLSLDEPVFKRDFGRQCEEFPVACWVQPRLMLLQTNNVESAKRNAAALRAAIEDLDAPIKMLNG